MKNDKNILDYLFLCIIINLIPVGLLSVFRISDKLYTITTLIAYIAQSALILWIAKDKIKTTTPKMIAILCVICLLQVITQIINYVNFGGVQIKDFANMIAVITNIYLFFFLCTQYQITREQFLKFMEQMILLGLIACVFNILFNFGSIIKIFNIETAYSVDIKSFFANRNQFGIFLLIMILSNLYIITNKRDKKYKFLQVFFSLNLLLTMSRNAMVGLFIIYGIRFILMLKEKSKNLDKKQVKLLIITTMLWVIVFVLVITTIPEIWKIVDKYIIRSYTITGESGRIKVWKNGIDILKYNPLTGVGRFQAADLNQRMYDSILNQFHSIYVETIVGYGIIGLLALIYFFYYLIKNIKSSSTNQKDKEILLMSIGLFLFISCFESLCRFAIGYVDTITMIYFMVLPFIYSNQRLKKEETKNE